MASRLTRIVHVHSRRLFPLASSTAGAPALRLCSPRTFWVGCSNTTVRLPSVQGGVRQMSETASATSSSSASSSKEKKDDSNIFLDNLGKIFMAGIAAVILAIVRSTKGRTSKINLRGVLEEEAALDPMEIDDLRVANSHLTPELYNKIVQQVKQAFPSGTATHDDFVRVVRTFLIQQHGENYTIELGHLLDRVILTVMNKRDKDTQEQSFNQTPSDEMPVAFYLTALSLALHSDVPERIRTLYQVLEETSGGDGTVRLGDVVNMVGYLQDTCQLIPDAQIVEIPEQKYPIQQHKKGKAADLVQWADGESERDVMDLESFATILCTRSVCAWGECHNRSLKVAK